MYEEKVSYRVGINWKDIILKIILLILFVLLLLWLFPSPQLDTFYDSVFNNNIQTMKDAATDYYTVDKLPVNIGDSTTMTLGEMLDNKLIVAFVDKDNKLCDNSASFVQVTKTSDDEYAMKVQLACGKQTDYILSTIGCHDVCEGEDCTPVIDPIEPVEPDEKETAIEYQHKKLVSDSKTTYSCPSGYTKNGSKCQKDVLGETINAKAEYFSETTMASDAFANTTGSYTVYATPTTSVDTVTYSCPSGYTLNGSTCYKSINATYTGGTTTYTCPAGYTRSGSTCYYTINATANTGTGSYSCPLGYTLSGTTCYKSYAATYTGGTTTYSCPANYNLSGTKCYKSYAATYTAGTTTYSCPANYTLSGTKCYKSYSATASSTTYGSWYVVKNYYQTTTKATYTTDTEKLVYNGMSYDYTCENHSQCPVKVAYYSYTLWRRTATTNYTCPNGGTLSGTTCTITTNATATTSNGSYSCPNGGTLSGSTCTITTNATATTSNGSYSCPSGGTLSGSTCTITTNATYSGGTIAYTCPAGYTKIGSTCTIYTTATSVVSEGSYSCPAGYTKDGTKCYVYSASTPNYSYTYSCPSGYTKEGSSLTTKCSKVISGSTSYYCKNANETLNGYKCYYKIAGSIKGYSCPSGYEQSGNVCLKYKKETIAATASTTGSSSYEYKWSKYSSLEGWIATGKTRTVEIEGSVK